MVISRFMIVGFNVLWAEFIVIVAHGFQVITVIMVVQFSRLNF